ncbi:FkbM family methyltransferase [Neptunomonas sp.]|uniref:FkbM family methyltransferase n=1 Tax=Neptunomonas sp. TaxID=1971898 RepID=UPI00356B2710
MTNEKEQQALKTDNKLSPLDILLEGSSQLLAEAKTFWFLGDWQALINIPEDKIEPHPERANIILLVASGYQQLGEFSLAERYCRAALEWGCDKKTVARVCIAGAYNVVGRIAALQGDEKKLEGAFSAAVDVGSKKDTELVAHTRAVREMASMGLLPQAAGLVSKKLDLLSNNPSKISNVDARISVLESELELLMHELSIGQQRLQVYRIEDKEQLGTHEVGSEAYIENLRRKSVSQLGQDLWVLEKTNYKTKGFFVEFGATDGVLLSNSYLLEKEFGWHGICAEPNPKFYERLQKNRTCIVSNQCIAGQSGDQVEFIFADEYGGMAKHASEDSHSEKRHAYKQSSGVSLLKTISLHDFLVLNKAPQKIDYLSVDTEGSEYEILSKFPFDEWDVQCVTVEHNYTERRNDIFFLLKSYGYERIEAQFDDWYFR